MRMAAVNKFFKPLVLTLLFFVSYSIIYLIKGVGIEYTDNQIKAICTICVIGLCKASLNLSKRIEK